MTKKADDTWHTSDRSFPVTGSFFGFQRVFDRLPHRQGATFICKVFKSIGAQSLTRALDETVKFSLVDWANDCTTGATRPPFQSMLSFAEGGTLTGTTANPAFQPGQRSPDHGIWTAEGDHTYRFLSEAYILFTTEPNPPVPGFPKGVQRITQTAKGNGNQLTTTGSAEFFDVEGNLMVAGCAKAVGERIE